MFEILEKRQLSDAVYEFTVHAPNVAAKAQAGQFLILRTGEHGERIPLTFSDWNANEGWIKFIFMRVGKTTHELSRMCEGESIRDVAGPLGHPTELSKGRWIVVGGGVGTSVAYPVARALCDLGAEVSVIIGSRNADLMILEDEIRALPLKEFIIATDDGSAGEKGLVTTPLARLCDSESDDFADPAHVFIVGPAVMMKFASMTTRDYGVPTTVSLNPIMIDGTGMCGACRCSVGDELKFACVDGPDFDGHKVDWEELMNRQLMYQEDERLASAAYDRECSC